ncbi:MAG: hypothetical protein ACE5HW_01940 [Candidatus Methanofastidiosia archaeon]
MKCRNFRKVVSEEFRYYPFCGFNVRTEGFSFSDEMVKILRELKMKRD